MKKFKILAIIVLIILVGLMFVGNCKKTNALSSEEALQTFTISERDQGQYGLVSVIDISSYYNSQQVVSFDFFSIRNYLQSTKYYLNITNYDQLRLYAIDNGSTLVENVSLHSRLLQFEVVYDVMYLYLIAYEILPNIQTYQGNAPQFDGFTRTMLFRHNLSSNYDLTTDWQNNNIYILPFYLTGQWTLNGLINTSYIGATETPTDINNWVDKQCGNATTMNYLLDYAYNEGTSDGYREGYSVGALDGYEDGYGDGEDAGYEEGHREGEIDGYHEGYDVGYADGQAGETAISPVFNIISNVFTAIGSIMAIQLVPHVPLGLFILVPLFFSALGLILWIWRRN